MVVGKCLFFFFSHFVFVVSNLANCRADSHARWGGAVDPVGDAGEAAVGRGQPVAAFAGAFGGQGGVAAGD